MGPSNVYFQSIKLKKKNILANTSRAAPVLAPPAFVDHLAFEGPIRCYGLMALNFLVLLARIGAFWLHREHGS